MAGKSLLPVLTGETSQLNRGAPLFWERSGKKAVRDGKWKLVALAGPKPQYELYDLEKDRGENTDLSAQHPEVVSRLAEAYKQWALANDVVDYEKLRPVAAAVPQATGRRNN